MYEQPETAVQTEEEPQAAPGVDVKKLRGALKASRKALSSFRDTRNKILKQFGGKWYSDNAAMLRVPNNVLAQAVTITTRNLFANNPHVSASTPYPQLKPTAAALGISLNSLLDEIGFDEQCRMLVLDAMFSMGIMKVGISQDGEVDVDGTVFPIGKPYAKVVDLDDWVHDSCARTWDEISFAGNRYRVPLEWAKNNPMFDEAARNGLKASHKDDYEQEEPAAEISGEKKTDEDEYQQYVELWDVWLPYEGKIVTFSACEKDNLVLQEIVWDGPTQGPYHILAFIDMPNNIMPVPPVAHWMDLHNIINSLTRKLARQAEREKQVGLFIRGNDEDAKKITDACDGETVAVAATGTIEEERYGGPDQATLLFEQAMREEFNRVAGNLDSLGGLGAQSDTLGQDQLIAQSASKQIQEMQDRVIRAIRGVVRSLAWWHWTDKIQDIEVTQEIGSSGIEVRTVIPPETRSEADFILYNIDIEPFSMRGSSPQEKLQTFNAYIQATTGFLTAAQGVAMLGKMPNIDVWNELWSRNSNCPEIKELWVSQAPPMTPEAQPEQPPQRMAPATTRNYVRKSVASGNQARENRKNMLMQGMMNAKTGQKSGAVSQAQA